MKKIISILAVCFLFASLIVPLASASYVCPAAYNGAAESYITINALHPSITSSVSEVGTCFSANATAYLYNVTFQLWKGNSPTTNLYAVLREVQAGTVGTNAYPVATQLDISYAVSSSTLAGTPTDVTFTFGGDYELASGTDYYIGIITSEGTISSTNYVRVASTGITDADARYNQVYYQSSTYYANHHDIYFIINGDTTEYAGATPTPTPTSAPTTPGSGDADMEALTAAILPFLVPLLVCLIPALLGYKFVGELGFFIGLNVGCILAYVTLAGTAYAFPLWGIILVGVMDVAVVLMRR